MAWRLPAAFARRISAGRREGLQLGGLMRCGVSSGPAFALSALLLCCVLFAACGGGAESARMDTDAPPPASSISAGAGGRGGADTMDEGHGGEGGSPPIDPSDPCGSLDDPSSPAARVAWLRERRTDIELTRAAAFDWVFPYAVKVSAGGAGASTLELERCVAMAGEEELCQASALPPPAEGCSVLTGPRFGLDPSLYNEGDNDYTFTLRLLRGGALQSQDSFVITVHYHPD
jgi:hypothetical protein